MMYWLFHPVSFWPQSQIWQILLLYSFRRGLKGWDKRSCLLTLKSDPLKMAWNWTCFSDSGFRCFCPYTRWNQSSREGVQRGPVGIDLCGQVGALILRPSSVNSVLGSPLTVWLPGSTQMLSVLLTLAPAQFLMILWRIQSSSAPVSSFIIPVSFPVAQWVLVLYVTKKEHIILNFWHG